MKICLKPLSLILLLLGGESINEAPQKNRWQKFKKMGLLVGVLQFSMTIMGYAKERERARTNILYLNNIIRATILFKHMFSFFLPLVYMCTKFFHMYDLEQYHSKSHHFDALMRTSCALPLHTKHFNEALDRLHVTSHKLNGFASVALVLIEVASITFGYYYIYHSTKVPPDFFIFYFYQVAICNFLATAFDTWIKLKETEMRFRLVWEFQMLILADITDCKIEMAAKGPQLNGRCFKCELVADDNSC